MSKAASMKAMISFIVTFPLLSVAIATSPYPNSTASDLEPVHFRLKSESAARILDINSIIGRMYFKYAAKGKQQTMVKVSSNEIKQFVIPIIDTNEQERIVGEIKSRIEQQNSIKAKIEKLRAKIDEIIRDAIIKPKKER